jgi:hypothetical protein
MVKPSLLLNINNVELERYEMRSMPEVSYIKQISSHFKFAGLVRRHTKLQMYTNHCSAGFISCGSISRRRRTGR